ncbi:winged helix-turn-helix domain-containing protein [Streptomyces sp. ALI-76-A]|uniref:winged helix-turn-helix domain-containing protein n=1 Tax=Streptomyces sp. ALI-76-A TaxID=3025736 RepID=UPI00256F37D9|nr:winged helix-turn-helix domain-containing protein [Streptomyces sp. ALI-76-A]MDL5206070.1 winged helix-turn-helix domain-containing protein [Streptomyces sp. ALI-76-A]
MSLWIRGEWKLSRRHGWSCQQLVRRAVERDDAEVSGWVKETRPADEVTAAALGAWLVFEDEAAVSMTSYRARTRILRLAPAQPTSGPGLRATH